MGGVSKWEPVIGKIFVGHNVQVCSFFDTKPTCRSIVRSSSTAVAICYVLPVLWMMSCFHTIGPMARARHVHS